MAFVEHKLFKLSLSWQGPPEQPPLNYLVGSVGCIGHFGRVQVGYSTIYEMNRSAVKSCIARALCLALVLLMIHRV